MRHADMSHNDECLRRSSLTLFGTLKDNMNALDFSLLLPDVMTIADEVDAQLTQTMGSYMKLANSPKAPKLAISAKAPAA
jgi:hypothetical protein